MSAVPPDANPIDTPVADAAAPPEPAAVGRSSSKKRRLIILAAVLVCLIGTGAYFKWSSVRDQKNTEAARALLAADGIAVIDSTEEPDDAPSAFEGWTTSAKMVRVQSSNNRITDAELTKIAGISQDMNLVLSSCPITNQGLSCLEGKRNVRCLLLTKTGVTDEGLKYLRGMNLQTLDLSSTKITDNGLAQLAQFDFPHLKEIALERTRVTNEGLMHLANFKRLEWVSIAGTKVTKEGTRRLKAKLPEVTFLD
jgi:hypothetical protein